MTQQNFLANMSITPISSRIEIIITDWSFIWIYMNIIIMSHNRLISAVIKTVYFNTIILKELYNHLGCHLHGFSTSDSQPSSELKFFGVIHLLETHYFVP